MAENIPPFTAFSFNRFLDEKKLMASHCTRCETLYLPPRLICPQCHGSQMEWAELGGKGKLAAFTTVYVAPSFMASRGYGRDAPYVTGIVELEEGLKISARILGVDAQNPESIPIGAPLTVEFLEEGAPGKVTLAFRI